MADLGQEEAPARDEVARPPQRAGSGAFAERAAVVALVAGLVGFVLLVVGPFLVGVTQARYLAVASDVLALVSGVLALAGASGSKERVDYALAGMIAGGVSLFLLISGVVELPGGT
jgi:hypothetical protein